MAFKKTGEETQKIIKAEIARSIIVCRLTALIIPAGTAKRIAKIALIKTS